MGKQENIINRSEQWSTTKPATEDAKAAQKRKKKEKSRQKRDLKRKMAKTDAKGAAVELAAEERKSKKAKVSGEDTIALVSSAAMEKPKKTKKDRTATDDAADTPHPSWTASKLAKVSGSLVEGAGDLKVFESDSE